MPLPKQQIIASRSFGEKVTELDDLKEAMGKYVQDAVIRLRADASLCGCVIAFVQSNPFDSKAPYYSKSLAFEFPEPTDCVLDLIKTAMQLLEHIYKSDVKYKKCGVILTDLIAKQRFTPDLLTDHSKRESNESLMQTLEAVQARYGKTKLAVGSCYLPQRKWSMNRTHLTQNYFSWQGLLKIGH